MKDLGKNGGDLMKLFSNILCTFLGHKADNHKYMLAYSIESYPMSYEVSIYGIAKRNTVDTFDVKKGKYLAKKRLLEK